MAKKYKFTIPEKYSVFKILGPNCIWCKEPVEYKDCELDHILPELLEKGPKTVLEAVARYKLHSNFAINSFYNWGPVHPRCNKGKSGKTFNDAPFIGELLQKVSQRVPEIEKAYKKIKDGLKVPLTLVKLESAIETQQIDRSLVRDLLDRKRTSNKIKSSVIYKAFNCRAMPIKHKGKYGKKSPRQLYDINYEKFDTKNKMLNELNCLIESDALKELMNARENFVNYLKDYDDDWFANIDSTHDYWTNYTLVSKKFISYTSTVRFYNTGAAHGQYSITGHNYYLDSLRPFSLRNVLIDYNAFITKITPLAYNKMIEELKKREFELEVDENSPIEKAWLTPEFNAFDNYHFTENSLAFIFNPYQISAWVYGAHFPEFSFEELVKLFPTELGLINLMSSIKKSVNTVIKKKD